MKKLLLLILIGLVSMPISAQYLTEDFETGWTGTPSAPSGWTQTRIRAINHATAEKDWLQNTWTGSAWSVSSSGTNPSTGAYSGTGVAWIDDYNYMSSSTPQASSRLESPVVNLSGSTSPYLRFWYFNNQGVGVNLNLRVMVSSNSGTTWDVLTPIVNGFTVTASTWNRISVAIPAPYRTANFKFAFEITNRYGTNNPFIDLVTVEEFTPTTITSTATGDWNAGATWVGGVVPTADNNVVIAAGHTVTMPTTTGIIGRCQNLTIDATGILNHSTGTANLIHAYGTITVNGTLNAYNGTSGRFIYCGGDFTINSGGTANFSAGTTSQSTGTTAISTGAAGIAFLNNQSASFTNGGTLTNNYIQNILHLGQGNFTYNNTVNCYRTFGLYLGSVNPNSNLTLGNAPSSVAQSVERANGTFSSNPTWNNTNISSRSNYYYSPNWVPITQTTLLTGNEIESIAGVRTVSGTFSMNTHNNLQLNYPLTVGTATTGSMTLTRGIIITDDTNLLTINTFFGGATGTAPSTATPSTTHGSYVVGPVQINFPASGTTTRNFPLGVGTGFNGSTPNSNVLKYIAVASTSAWTGSVIKASIVGAPSGTVNSPLTNLFGIRAYRLQLISGSDLPGTATVSIRGRNSTFGNSDNLYGDIGELRVAQSPNLTGAWTERSATTGSGVIANNTDYARTTAVPAPGPIAPLATYGEYFAFATTATVINPSGVTATPISSSQIDVAFTPNIFSNNVLIVWNDSSVFTAPSGPPPSVGSPFAGGTVLYYGLTSPQPHSSLTSATPYYYKAFSYDGTNYSTGVPVNATTFCDAIATFPHTQSFGATFPSCWAYSEGSAGATYHWATTTADGTHGVSGPQAGTHFMFLYVYLANTTYNPYYLTSPEFTLDATPKQVKYYYYLGTDGYKLPSDSTLALQISTNNGVSWTNIFVHDTSNSVFATSNSTSFWTLNTVNLSAYASQTVKFRFKARSNYGSSFCDQGIDEFVVENVPTYPPPTALTATGITDTSAILSWTQSGSPISWDIEYGATPFSPTGTPTNTGVTNPFTLSPLNDATNYAYYVRANFGSGNYSTWAGPYNFTTLCTSVTAFNENFDLVTAPVLPNCWSKYTSPSWSFQTVLTYTTSPNSSPNSVQLYSSGATASSDAPLLITPQVSNLSSGAVHLKFYAKGASTNLSVIVGTMTNPANSATFTAFDTVTGLSTSSWTQFSVDFSSYSGSDTYLAFKHPLTTTYSYIYIDDVVWEPLTAMVYDSSTTTQNTTDVGTNQTNQQVIGIKIYTSGSLTPLSVTNFNLNTNGTTNAAVDITNAKLFYTGTSGTFAATSQFGSTVASPSGAFAISGSQTLATGTNYFWLTYDIPSGATDGNLADAECNQISVGSNYVPTIQAPAGARTIKGPMSGTYNVGLTPFNKATGKNLTVQKLTRKTEQPIFEKVKNEQIIKSDNTALLEELPFSSEKPSRTEMVDEDYYILMENGQPYSGEYSIRINEEVQNQNGGSQFTETEVFSTLTAAISALNNRGVNGPVTFVLKDTKYSASETFPLTINPVTGGSATNTVTIKPFTGLTDTIIGSAANSTIFNINSSNIIIDGSNSGGTTRDLLISNTSTTGPTTINIGSPGTSAITNVIIKNCIVINTVSASAIVVGDGDTLGGPGYFNDITIQNNSIQKAYIGIYNKAVLQSGNGSGLKILSNDLSTSGTNAIAYMGTYLQDITGAEVSGNTFANFETAGGQNDKGIHLYNTNNTLIEKNKIYSLKYTGTSGYAAYGISNYFPSATVSTNVIKNNMISDLSGDGDDYTGSLLIYNPMGIFLYGTQSGAKVYHNSIYLSGNTLNYSANSISCGIVLGTGTSADIRNNIIVNNLGLLSATGYGSAGIFLQSASSQLEQANFNDIVVAPTGSGVKNLGQIATTGYTTLAAWKTATGKEESSQNTSVTFTSATDLHLSGGSVGDGNLASAYVGVSTDFDGDARNAYWPYMGADEITGSPLALPKLTLKALIQGIYANSGNEDTLVVYLTKPTSPYTKYVPVKGLTSASGTDFYFPKSNNETSYYIAIKNRNSLETWSASTVATASFPLTFDMTSAQAQAFGGNTINVSGKWCIYNGDVVVDEFIDGSDVSACFNDGNLGASGYIITDLSGDDFVDGTDVALAFNNSNLGVGAFYPTKKSLPTKIQKIDKQDTIQQ